MKMSLNKAAFIFIMLYTLVTGITLIVTGTEKMNSNLHAGNFQVFLGTLALFISLGMFGYSLK